MHSDIDSLIGLHLSSIGTPVTSEDIEVYDRLSQIQTRGQEARGDYSLRIFYGRALLVLLFGQVMAVTAIAFLMGFGVIRLDRWVATTFVGGTLGEVVAMTLVVVRYLFPTGGRQQNDE